MWLTRQKWIPQRNSYWLSSLNGLFFTIHYLNCICSNLTTFIQDHGLTSAHVLVYGNIDKKSAKIIGVNKEKEKSLVKRNGWSLKLREDNYNTIFSVLYKRSIRGRVVALFPYPRELTPPPIHLFVSMSRILSFSVHIQKISGNLNIFWKVR